MEINSGQLLDESVELRVVFASGKVDFAPSSTSVDCEVLADEVDAVEAPRGGLSGFALKALLSLSCPLHSLEADRAGKQVPEFLNAWMMD